MKMAADYKRITRRSREDPGTAGDQGEANWQNLLKEWLPAGYHVRTKGRIVSIFGKASPQLDVVVLDPGYPKGLLDQKLYLAAGVLAAFECKITLRPKDIENAFKKCRKIKELMYEGSGRTTPYQELHAPIIYGLLAHSHAKTLATTTRAETVVVKADSLYCNHPKFMLDCMCIADIACWKAVKYARYPSYEDVRPMSSYTRSASGGRYLTKDSQDNDPICTPIGGFVTDLLTRLAWRQSDLRLIAQYFRHASVAGPVSQGRIREWPPSIFSDSVRARLAVADVHSHWTSSSWEEWQWEFP